ncbi:MAG TPA: phage tail sheath C-terminal domain-containing protein, partial [Ktedonobacterales bacterium]|nr:phage tail sheath C-terminal domain-containing protein [Ktedonobacterales bacterium]
INNWSQFLRLFVPEGRASTPLSHAVYGFFNNGGSRCYVVNIGENAPITGGGRGRTGLAVLEEVDEVAIVAAPGYTDPASYDALLTHCENLRDRVAILDAAPEVPDTNLLTKVAATPVSSPKQPGDSVPEEAGSAGLRPRPSDGGYGAFYFPWITIRDPLAPDRIVSVPPSGHIAGVWARNDAQRGVHKAPANEIVRGALNLTYRLTRDEQGELNQMGVNCIRFFPGEGIRVWGARTLANVGSEWTYLNVRRLFNMIEESIALSTKWIVFEPNDRTLWKSIRRDATAFLTRLWRDGALMGRTPEEAFFVKCDEETNPEENIDAGMVVVLIGIAPVKPAEFIIFRISQSASGAQLQSDGGR